MKRGPALTFAKDLPAPALSHLEAAGDPAWLIDPAGGRILAANGAGAALLGLDAGTSPPLLDASMPAIARLRALVSDDGHDGDAREEPLVFWARGGAVRQQCRVRFLRDGVAVLAVVVAIEERGSELAHPPPPQSQAHAAPPQSPALFLGDDAAKLKEIARRIREGQVGREGQAGASQERRRREGKGSEAVAISPDAASGVPTAAAPISEPIPIPLHASLAHELRTPVSAIAVAAEIMKDERFGPLGSARYVGYAADIHGNAQHMLRLIDRMLAEGAEPDDAQHAFNFAELDVAELLQTAVSQLAPLAERAGIALKLELASRLPHVIADATSLRQILFNLVTNALKFTERGGQVTVSARYGGDGPLVIAVSDTGPGMTKTEAERLLAPARTQRSSGRAKASGVGLGLGLPLVKALAKKNGADLSIDSAPGKGTTASIMFAKDRVVPV
jgi:two-component system cell cycle sensor histidine kinase PleC